MDTNEIDNEEIYSFEPDDQVLDATRIQMVLGSLEKSLVDKIILNIESLDINSGVAQKCYKNFRTFWS